MTARGISRRTIAGGRSAFRSALLAGAALSVLALAPSVALAQASLGELGANVNVPAGSQLFLEADTVTYDSDKSVVTAAGGVQIDYGGYKLVARNIVYDQASRRLVASGDVELVEPGGNRIYADSIDVTDDFANGFVEALRIETPDNTRFAAGQAVRGPGQRTTFEQGVYTACEACEQHPERPPTWQVKARRIVWDQDRKVIRYYGARLELFGAPLVYLPYFASPDPTVKRQSGLLAPSFKSSSKTGFGVRVPYYFALDDSSDLTIAGTPYSKQGFLGEAEYRKAFENGYFTLQTAGISQSDPTAFDDFRYDGVSINQDFPGETRGMVGTTGRFALSDRWTFGWDVLAQTDNNFSNNYEIENFSQVYHTSEIYLTGLGEQSFFDLRAQKFDVQTQNRLTEDVQPYVLPTLDYQYIDENPVLGGQVTYDVNVTNLRRDATSPGYLLLCESAFIENGLCNGTDGFPYRTDVFRRNTLEGDYSRATTQAEWRRTFTTAGGLLLTPSLSARADVYRADMSAVGYPFGDLPLGLGGVEVDEAGLRGMATAGLEARYPYLIETANASHVITPIAQLLIRPDESVAGELPNEDAQSLVFNAGNLFSEDKFSGYDRIEGGTRANVGVQYSGVFGAGYAIDALIGQSFHLAGENPYAQVDYALVGFESGLQNDRSDYVSAMTLATPIGVSLGAQGRFDKDTLDVNRADLMGGVSYKRVDTSVVYSLISAQPTYGFPEDRHQVTTAATLRVTDEIRTFGSVSYDIENAQIIDRSFGIGYADECFSLIAEYKNTSDRYNLTSAETKVLFKLSLRTLADADFGYGLGSN
ncbi:LPS-assembly protein LptD [Aureimonas jatrophae]|uniref:LPS-assembly protein LptD n=1 Tax=Aureimonas jatrophae TaxID=1166073 RepID=A0A1H0G9U6_9HYPH|nr:LPS-assembly protein LptD [Aureimonas jatrophae]MBB3949478.1 LPS-assembly protein [Aureimonas jatrophae]SDO03618.1 LPS-assembly protein [Aureimonas jatrophae]